MTDEINLPPLPHPSIDEYPGPVLVVAFDDDHMHDYATQAVTEDRAQRDADHLAELQAYELTVSNLREQLMTKEQNDIWNRKCRLVVDALLAERGYHEDSSARHNLAMMNFDSSPAVVEKLAQPAQKPFPHEAMDKVASARYRIVKSKATIWPCAVVAGDGEQEIFSGSESTCKHVARKLAGAFLDGAFYAQAQLQKELEASTCYMTNDATREETLRRAVEADRALRAPQVPMTDDEIIKYFDKVSTKLGFGLDDILAFTYGALCAQSHHGIKEKP